MDAIERAHERSTAYHVLGLDSGASADDIKAAWHRIAFDTHPDRNAGDRGPFETAKAAYDLLAEGRPVRRRHGTRPGGKPADAMPRRPKVAARVVHFSSECIEACRDFLERDGAEEDANAPSARDHLPSAVNCHGRVLDYHVETDLAQGINRVVLPTAILEDHSKVKPKVLRFNAAKPGAGHVDVPENLRARMFPGARQVRITFAATQS